MYNLPNNYLFKAAVKVGWGRGGGGGGGGGGAKCICT